MTILRHSYPKGVKPGSGARAWAKKHGSDWWEDTLDTPSMWFALTNGAVASPTHATASTPSSSEITRLLFIDNGVRRRVATLMGSDQIDTFDCTR